MNFYIINPDDTTDQYVERLSEAAKAGKIDLGKIQSFNIDQFVGYLSRATKKDLKSQDHLIPSHNAPHLLAQVFIKLLENHGFETKMIEFPSRINTPYEHNLEKGLKAISFTNETCPEDCIEAELCPAKETELTWNIGKTLKDYAEENNLYFISFKCTHLVNLVSTIKIRDVIDRCLEIKEMLSKAAAPQHRGTEALIATHSNCHGLAALLSIC